MQKLFVTIIFVILFLILFIYLATKDFSSSFSDINVGCKYTRFGCCDDKITTKLNIFGTNCRGF